jgi:hypothetical protein
VIFNGDGKTDVAVITAGDNVPGQVILLLGNGDGTFQSAKTSVGIYYPNSAVEGDFNGDGKLDLAIGGSASASNVPVVALLLGNGDGTFQAPTTAFSGGGNLTAADVNGDGNLDLAVEAAPMLEVYLGAGNGTFSGPSSYMNYNLFFYASTSSPAVADFNLDGKLDIAAGNYVLLGNGNGTFHGQPAVPLAGGLSSGVMGDFDKNGTQDVAVISGDVVSGDGTLYILSNDGTGGLSLEHTYALSLYASNYPPCIAAADLRGSGNLDLVVTGVSLQLGSTYGVLLGNGDGSFQAPVFTALGGGSTNPGCPIVVADFNNDHKPDLALSSAEAIVLLGNGDGTFGPPSSFFDGNSYFTPSLVSADFNGDGNADLAASGSSGLAILLGKGDGTFQPAAFLDTGGLGLLTGDLNGDGKADLVTAGEVLLGNGDGTFNALAPQPQIQGLFSLADVNGDGKLDLTTSQSGECCGIDLGNGDGTFGPYLSVLSFGYKFSAAQPIFALAADMNGDGKPDLIIGENSSTTASGVFVLANTTFPPPVPKISPSSVTFPSQDVGSSSNPVPITLSNTGKGLLNVTGVTIGGTNANDFSQTNNCTTVQPGAKCTINVIFTPTAAGAASAYLKVADNAAGGTQMVALSGTGVAVPDFGIGPASGSKVSDTVSAGQSATFSLVVTPANSFTGTVSLSCSISPTVIPAPTCTLPSSVNVTTSAPAPVAVKVSTTAAMTTGTVSYPKFPSEWMSIAWTVVLFAVGLPWILNRRRLPVLATPIAILTLVSFVGCGSGSSSSSHTTPGTPAGTYTATVSASSGNLIHNTSLTVVVQ